jgi:peptidoglycan/xylan/chitin deacetylase (PgdA/CDA1 family)
MVNKRELVASVAAYSGLTGSLRWLSRRNTAVIPVLAYHGVSNDPAEPALDEGLKGPTFDLFIKQLDYMNRHYSITTFTELLEIIRKDPSRLHRERMALITFDDGFRNNYDVVFPALMDRGMKATVFIVTDCVQSGEPFWFEKISLSINLTEKKRLRLEKINGREWSLENEFHRRSAIAEIKKKCKEVPDDERREITEEVTSELRFDSIREKIPRIVLSPSEVVEMNEYGIEFGSHTLSHPNLTMLDDEGLAAELTGSKKAIEEMTGKKAVSFAYPSGLYDQRVEGAVEKAGYSTGVTYNHGLFCYPHDSFYLVDRILVEREFSFPLFKLHLLSPNISLGELFPPREDSA